MGSSKLGSNAPDLGNGPAVGDQFNRFDGGSGTSVENMENPVIGISAPTGDLVSSVDGLGGDNASGDESYASLGEGISIPEFAPVGDYDDIDAQKGGGGSPNSANPTGNNIGVLLPLGTNPDGSHFFTGIRNVDATLIGSKWGTTNLTFSFPTSGTNYNGSVSVYEGVANYQIGLGTQQQAAARAAFAQLAAVSGLTFTEITETDTVHANIRISQTADQDVPSAYGTFPSDTVIASGDIWFGRNNQPYYDLAYKGTWGFATIMHEIGHTMGLKHGHQDYTSLDLSDSFGTSPRYGTQSLTPDRDGQAWSLMTYTPAPFTNSNFAGEKINQPQTYMQYDVAALQYLYGANFNTNSGDSVYTFNLTTGEMSINGVGQGAPSGNKIFLTIWDGGGNDTIDVSNYANGVTVDLRPGQFSTFDQNQLANNLAYQNLTSLAPGNIAMSLLYNNDARSLIENAKGGIGNDVFVGNTANNTLDGGAGSDTVVFTNTTGVNVTLNDTNTDVIVTHDGETDTLRSIENIGGTSGNDTITGNGVDNVLTGGSGGADVLSGGGGNDRLIGGGFTVTTNFIVGSPASQPDITKAQATNNNSIANAVNTAGAFDIDANPNITNSTTIPHATINATATGGGLEYYRVDVTGAGAQAVFDIDGAGSLTDSIIELVDAAGNLLATNDTGPGDPGTTVNDDAYITYTFATAGTYYIRVGRYTGTPVAQALTAGQTYQLNISLQGAAGSTTFTLNNTSSLVATGGEGNDYLQGTVGNDTLNGGNGNDTASFVTAYNGGGAGTTGVTVDLTIQGIAQNTIAAGNDTLTGIENLIGSSLNDTLIGNNNDNVIEGGAGDDTLIGGSGLDTASYASAASAVTVNLGLQFANQNTAGAGTDLLSGFENLLGSGFNDTLTGDAGANVLTGGAGDDTLNPGANAGGTVDLLDGGLGTDTASFAGYAAGVTATLNGASDGTATVAAQQIATLRSIENLVGSSNADTLTGDGNDNAIEGGLGDDTLVGGGGIDTVVFTGSTAVTLNLATLTAQATGWGNDTISGFENVRTGSGADNITGDGNDNTFFDGGGADIYNGAGGNDTIDYTNIATAVTVNLNTVVAQTVSTGNSDTITNIENVVGSLTAANTLTGSAVANVLTGGNLVDVIEGRSGNDVIYGGIGNDTLLGGTSAALDDLSTDTLEGGLGNDYLSGGGGDDTLRGGDGDDTLVGGIGNTSRQYFTGTNIDAGNDTYDGGNGSDTAIMVYDARITGLVGQTVGIGFDLRSLAGNSNITYNGAIVGSLTSIETVIFRGTAFDDTVGGTGNADNLFGGAGNDVLDGWFGNDLLEGGAGDDVMTGGEGLDTASYSTATAGVVVDLRLAGAQNTVGAGSDTLSSIEYVTGSAFGDTLRGTDDFNLILDTGVGAGATNLSQTDSLFGYGGNDTIIATRSGAVSTNVNMDGGDGDDIIELRSGTTPGAATQPFGLIGQGYLALGATSSDRNSDVVTVDGGAGNDRIILTGVALATVNAGSGNDIISVSMRGALGLNNYQLTLGSGADIIQLGGTTSDVTTTARDSRVTDFERGNAGDKFELTSYLNGALTGYTLNSDAFASGHLRLVQNGSDLELQVDRDAGGVANSFVTIFKISNGYIGGFTAFNFDNMIGALNLTGLGILSETLTGTVNADTLSGMDGNDSLFGLAGNDTLDGGNGDDILRGGLGDDTLIGGIGIDRADYADVSAGVSVNLALAGAQNTIGAGIDTLSGIENLTGTGFNDTLIGNAGVNTIDGGAGNDYVAGGAGDDVLIGGLGIDTLYYADQSDAVQMNLAAGSVSAGAQGGNDQVSGFENAILGSGNDLFIGDGLGNVVQGNDGDDLLFGVGGDDQLYGGSGIDQLFGGDGNDLLDGGTGADSMSGGAGDDTYVVDNAGDQISEFGGSGTDTVRVSFSYTLATGFENLIGSTANETLTGNDAANALIGGGGADILVGLGGDDSYVVDSANDVVLETAGQGNDTVYATATYALAAGVSVETLTAYDRAATDALNLTGNELGQAIYGNNGVNALIGGGGADTLFGFGGDDAYLVDSSDDVVTEFASQGTDTVYTTVGYTLAAGSSIEVLTVYDRTTTNALNLTGNELGQTIYGNDGANVINGGAGNDTLYGMGGADTFAFTTALGAGNVDSLADFVHGTDKIGLDDAVFTQIGGLGALNANAFVSGTAALDADDRIIYNSATGQLFYDADGVGGNAQVLFATLQPGTTLTATDFQVI